MGRITHEEIQNSIFRPNDKQENTEDVITVYTLFGEHTSLDEDGFPVLDDEPYKEDGIDYINPADKQQNAFAKSLKNGKKQKFYIKQDGSGKCYNPIGLYGREKQTRGSQQIWKFREVGKKAFSLYLKFLKTRNLAWLKQAERE